MNKISSFCNSLKNKYQNTSSVLEQIEELRDTLHIKTEEYQSEGMGYDEAVEKAIESLGCTDELFASLLDDETRVYYRYALITGNVIAGVITGTVMFLYTKHLGLDSLNTLLTMLIFSFILISILAFMTFYNFSELKKPISLTLCNETGKKQIIASLLSWLLYSIIYVSLDVFFGLIRYSLLPVIGFFNWPLCILITHCLIKSKKFNFKT